MHCRAVTCCAHAICRQGSAIACCAHVIRRQGSAVACSAHAVCRQGSAVACSAHAMCRQGSALACSAHAVCRQCSAVACSAHAMCRHCSAVACSAHFCFLPLSSVHPGGQCLTASLSTTQKFRAESPSPHASWRTLPTLPVRLHSLRRAMLAKTIRGRPCHSRA